MIVAPRSRVRSLTPPKNPPISDAERAKLPRVNIPPVAIGKARGMDMFPRKYSECLEHNQKIKTCCRNMDKVTGRMFASPSAERDEHGNQLPDIFIATCQECGCNHYRMAVG